MKLCSVCDCKKIHKKCFFNCGKRFVKFIIKSLCYIKSHQHFKVVVSIGNVGSVIYVTIVT